MAVQQLSGPALHFVGGVQGHVPVKLLPRFSGGVGHQLPRLQLCLLIPRSKEYLAKCKI
ncbi:hypothetical protein SDC9_192857 [bioreactor metagenome]|uniref:Uncharacterized protein n=1 Tax=bioreactor metagenome TaxID=1076179 RepID=A0A645I299_9ZZZZ